MSESDRTRRTSTKRERTSRRIQHETLALVSRLGIEAVTTEMIAAQAGISRRTFFNHYRNKEEAMAGPVGAAFSRSADWFVHSRDALLPDLQKLLEQTVADALPNRSVIRNILQIQQDAPELRPVFGTLLNGLTADLQSLLNRRLQVDGGSKAARLVARLVTEALALEFQIWARDDTLSVSDIPARVIEDIERTVGLIA